MDERRAEARRYILANFDRVHFEGSMMYGVRFSEMDRDELAATLCYFTKNPDIIWDWFAEPDACCDCRPVDVDHVEHRLVWQCEHCGGGSAELRKEEADENHF